MKIDDTNKDDMRIDDVGKHVDIGVPGPLRTEVVITLHTREAYTLFAGRPKDGGKDYSTNNLNKFAIKMNAIWFAARNDDPFVKGLALQQPDG